MARAIWSGSLSFGLVNIPVHLVSAVVDRGLHFHQLHDKDLARIREQRIPHRSCFGIRHSRSLNRFEQLTDFGFICGHEKKIEDRLAPTP